MAVVRIAKTGTVGLQVQTGTSATGSPVFRTRNFGNIVSTATDDAIFSVASALAGLQKHTLSDIVYTPKSSLINQ